MRSSQSTDAWQPVLCFGLLAVAQLAVFWFEAYRLLSIAFLLLTAALVFVQPRPGVTLSSGSQAFAGFVAVYAYMLLAIAWAPRPSDAAIEFARALAVSIPPFVFGWIVARRYSVPSIGLGFALLPVSFAFQAVYNFQAYGDAMQIDRFSLRTYLAGLICLSAPIVLARYLSYRRQIDLIFCLIALLLSLLIQSRSSLIIVLPALLYVVKEYNRRAFNISLIAVVGVAIAAILFVASGGAIGRFSPEATSLEITDAVLDELADRNEEGVDLERRAHAFIAGTLFLQNPIFGAGYSSVLQTFIDELDLEVSSHGFVPGTLGELGVLGLAIIMAFIWKCWTLLHTLRSRMPREFSLVATGYTAGFGAVVAYGFFHQTFEWAYFPLLVGILVGASRIPLHRSARATQA